MGIRLRTLGLAVLATMLVAPTWASAQTSVEFMPSRAPRQVDAWDPPYKYRFTPPAGRWSVFGGMGSRGCPWDPPAPGGCIRANVTLFDEWGTPPLARSHDSRHVEFVAIDGNHQPVDEYAAKVTTSGDGTAWIEADYSGHVLSDGTQPYARRHFIRVWDTYLRAGTTYRFSATTGDDGAALSIYLLDSDPKDSTTWHQAARQGIRARGGSTIELVYTNDVDPPGRGDWYGLVVTQDYYSYSHPIQVSRATVG